MKKYKLYLERWSDTIIGEMKTVSGAYHFFNEKGELTHIWPLTSIVEVYELESTEREVTNEVKGLDN